jgi:quercetin dioxygenase-like cupin family protein
MPTGMTSHARAKREGRTRSGSAVIARESAMQTFAFDDRNIAWQTVEGFEHAAFSILHIDETARIVDLLFKFAANERIALHRHGAAYCTLVLQGELRLYRPDGSLKEIRPVGSYVAGQAGGEPHTEGGGDQDVIVYFTNRDIDGPVYELLDANHEIVATFGIPEFKALFAAQVA